MRNRTIAVVVLLIIASAVVTVSARLPEAQAIAPDAMLCDQPPLLFCAVLF